MHLHFDWMDATIQLYKTACFEEEKKDSHSVGLTDRKETQNSLKGNCGSVRFSAASAGLKAHCNLIHMHLYAKAALQTAAGLHVTLQTLF